MYNVYDKPWRAGGGAAQTIYKPTKANDKDIYGDDVEKLIKTSRYSGRPFIINILLLFVRFVPDKDFSGTDRSQTRDGPVQFEKAVEEDPFGLNQFLSEAKQAKRPSNRYNIY